MWMMFKLGPVLLFASPFPIDLANRPAGGWCGCVAGDIGRGGDPARSRKGRGGVVHAKQQDVWKEMVRQTSIPRESGARELELDAFEIERQLGTAGNGRRVRGGGRSGGKEVRRTELDAGKLPDPRRNARFQSVDLRFVLSLPRPSMLPSNRPLTMMGASTD